MLEVTDQASATLRHVDRDVARILINRDAISSRIAEMGAAINRDLEALPGDVEIVLMPILTGSIVFAADLIRHLPQKFRVSVVVARTKSILILDKKVNSQLPMAAFTSRVMAVSTVRSP